MLDVSAQKSVASHTSSNYHHQYQKSAQDRGFKQSGYAAPSTSNSYKSDRLSENNQGLTGINSRKVESQTDAFKHRQQRSQVRASDTTSKAGQSIMNFKPYSLKDFTNLQQTNTSQKLGGLGANIGGEEWNKAKQKRDQINDFS